MPILVPGVGAQLGPLELAVSNGVDSAGRNAIINVSRAVIYAEETGKKFDEAARGAAKALRTHINRHLDFLGYPWPEMSRTA